MNKSTYEFTLQNYLIENNGFNLRKIDSSLELIESEHIFRGGRIDILAKKETELVGIELKSKDYHTRSICAQLLNYLNYITAKNGEIYFIAPRIKYGIYSTLKSFYDNNKLRFFEVSQSKQAYFFKEIKPENIFEHKSRKESDEQYTQTGIIYNEKLIKGLSLLIKDKKSVNLVNSILDDRKPRQKQLEDIAGSVIDIASTKDNFLKTAYELLKLL